MKFDVLYNCKQNKSIDQMEVQIMTNIIFHKQTNEGTKRCEIIIDKDNCLGGNKRGNRNYIVIHHMKKGYRVSSMIGVYKQLKAEGYKLVCIY